MSPKVQDADKTNFMQRDSKSTIGLLCPSQAYPTPVFRYNFVRRLVWFLWKSFASSFLNRCLVIILAEKLILIIKSNGLQTIFLEPIGSVSPKVNDIDRSNIMQRESKSAVSLPCPSQAYPTPVFR